MKQPKSKPFNETEYLFSSKENAEHLAQSIEQLRKGEIFKRDLIEPLEDDKICSDKDV